MSWIGIVSIDGNLVSDGLPGIKEEAKKRAEGLLNRILESTPDKHGFVHFHCCKVDWSNAYISDQKPCCINLSGVVMITTNIMQYDRNLR